MTFTASIKTDSSTPRENRSARICQEVAELLGDLSGLELAADQFETSFLELGFDSLFLTQAAQKIQNKYGVKVAFRQLLDTLGSIRLIAEYLDQQLPQDAAPAVAVTQVEKAAEPASMVAGPNLAVPMPQRNAMPPAAQAGMVVDGKIATLMQQQLQAVTQLIQSQLQILGSAPASAKRYKLRRNHVLSQPKTVAVAQPLLPH